jgi:acetamidase/formamidase
MPTAAAEHVFDPAVLHHAWDNALEPRLVVQPGDTVHYELLMAGHGQVDEDSSFAHARFDFETMYNLGGPVHVEGAEPGDTLEVEVRSLEPGDWGWTAVLPGLGLLPEDFPTGYLKIWDLRAGGASTLCPGVRVPLAPFLGTMGNHPDEPGIHPPFPPHKGGGNLDNRHLVAGSSLFLPVWCPGALFSCGDPHAAQGDGEICVSAIECPMRASLRFRLHKRSIPAPSFRVPGPVATATEQAGYHATMGLGPDLMNCAKDAARAMIHWLTEEHALTREDAYVLCSVAGDLKIHEIVDSGVWNVGLALPLSVFQ